MEKHASKLSKVYGIVIPLAVTKAKPSLTEEWTDEQMNQLMEYANADVSLNV